jgi:hypothetical protein
MTNLLTEWISKFYECKTSFFKYIFYIFSKQSTTVKSPPVSTPEISVKINPGDNHNDLEHIEIKLDKNSEEQSTTSTQKSSTNNKHSPSNNPNSAASGGFSLKNPVSSFRSWVTNKKSSKDDATPIEQSTSSTYTKVDTSPTPRKSSSDSDTSKRNRTNSATTTPTTNNHQEANSARVKKKSSFSLRSNKPETTNENDSNEQTGTGSSGGGAFGYLKNLVRGEKQ